MGAGRCHLPESLRHSSLGVLPRQDPIVDVSQAIEREIGLIFV